MLFLLLFYYDNTVDLNGATPHTRVPKNQIKCKKQTVFAKAL